MFAVVLAGAVSGLFSLLSFWLSSGFVLALAFDVDAPSIYVCVERLVAVDGLFCWEPCPWLEDKSIGNAGTGNDGTLEFRRGTLDEGALFVRFRIEEAERLLWRGGKDAGT